MRSFLYWITGYLPCRIISDGNTPYLERYYLFTLLGWRFYLHRFVGSDPDRGLHTHPWRLAFSIILAGWYWEETSYGTRRVAWFNWLTGDSRHRVVLQQSYSINGGFSDRPCWTLFFHRAEKVKDWGFDKVVDEATGARLYIPYTYTRSDENPYWWKRVPKGRNEPRRAAA